MSTNTDHNRRRIETVESDRSSDETTQTTDTSVSRRSVLTGAGVAGLTALGLSLTSSAAADAQYYDEYRTVVNVVEAGADDTGTESITPVLESLRSDNTLLYFPPGRYYMDSQFRFTNFEKFGVVGEDATLVPANYYDFDGPRYRLFRLGTQDRPGGDLRFEGFTVDQTAPNTGIRAIEAWVSDRLEARDITIRGQHDSGTWGPALFNVVDSDGTGIVERFRAPGGAAWVDNTPNESNRWRGPIGIEANHTDGILRFRRCVVGGFPNNGLYAFDGTGQIVVEGGLFKNSNPVSLRIGGTNSRILWPTVEVSRTRPQDVSQRAIQVGNGNTLVRGAAIRNTSPMSNSHAIAVMNTSTGAQIEDTTIEISGDQVTHGIVVSPEAGSSTITDTEITHETGGGYPLWIRGNDTQARVTCDDITITGRAGDGGGFRDGIRCERTNCRFEHCDVDQRGRDGTRRNAFVNTGTDCTVYEGTYRASGHPFVELGSNTVYVLTDAESYDETREAIHLYDRSDNVRLIHNRLANGIRNDGSEGLVTVGNAD